MTSFTTYLSPDFYKSAIFFPYTAEWSRKLPNEHQQGAWITYSKRTFSTSENRVLSPFLFKNLARSIVLYIKLHTPYLFCTEMSLKCRFWSYFIINHFNDVINEMSISAIFVLFLWHHTHMNFCFMTSQKDSSSKSLLCSMTFWVTKRSDVIPDIMWHNVFFFVQHLLSTLILPELLPFF